MLIRDRKISLRDENGVPEKDLLVTQTNLAIAYQMLGRFEQAMLMQKDVYFGRLKIHGVEHSYTLTTANNYASSLVVMGRFETPRHCCAKRSPWRDVYSEILARPRSGC